ncbi:putative ATP-binding cassette transporter [Mesorhizobium soli]|uniref:ABC transporter ATP-binding protein/permease n=1 Tax=Pseudaminobacter soli (ex Li et al. 2025) TaxID=1295366 RepID=UPI002474CCF3|nr:SbmA/BacA-like family transporter [Mesorhizobium soli]MDH6232352.1 putative ATP-binding cassette transporter [Mesorhizobium soli]
MERQQTPLRVTARRFVRTVRIFVNSEVGCKAKLIFVALAALLGGTSVLNVVNSFVGRYFMSAIAERHTADFARLAVYYIGVFAASTVVAVFARFAEERLALLWREFLTRRAVGMYLAEGAYYRLDVSGLLSHPDQRISEDIRAFTTTTLSFIIMALNSSLTVLAFSGVLWTISPLLFVVAVLYAACGSYLTIILGRPLVNLNYDQLDKEAAFRASLIHVRENAEPIIVTRGEERQATLLMARLDDLISNFRWITAVNRNVGFFTTGYNWMIQIIPALIIAPAFFRGEIEFGVITQSAAAFAMLVAAFSFIVTQIQQISSFAAVVTRLNSLSDAIEKVSAKTPEGVEIVDAEGRLAYEHLTLLSFARTPLLTDLNVSIPAGRRILVTGPEEGPGMALFRATAGLPTAGTGRIIRPGPDQIKFVPQQPYLPQGTLRQVLLPPDKSSEVPDERIFQLLRELDVDLANLGLDTEQDWETALTMHEQQLLALAGAFLAASRILFVEKVEAVLDPEQLLRVLGEPPESSITFVNFGKANGTGSVYDAVLEYGEDGSWTWQAN